MQFALKYTDEPPPPPTKHTQARNIKDNVKCEMMEPQIYLL